MRPGRGMAQSGSASALGAEGRRFKSCCPDHENNPGARGCPRNKTRFVFMVSDGLSERRKCASGRDTCDQLLVDAKEP